MYDIITSSLKNGKLKYDYYYYYYLVFNKFEHNIKLYKNMEFYVVFTFLI